MYSRQNYIEINQLIKADHALELYNLAVKYYDEKSFPLAEMCAEAAYAIDPKSIPSLKILALIAQNGYEVKANPALAALYHLEAQKIEKEKERNLIISQGRVPHAEIPGFEEAKKTEEAAEAIYQLGKKCQAENKEEAAITCFEFAAAKNHPSALNETGLWFAALNEGKRNDEKLKKAVTYFKLAIEQEERPEFYYNLGRTLSKSFFLYQQEKYSSSRPEFYQDTPVDKKSYDEAKKYLELALCKGNKNALLDLAKLEYSHSKNSIATADFYEAAISQKVVADEDLAGLNNKLWEIIPSQSNIVFSLLEIARRQTKDAYDILLARTVSTAFFDLEWRLLGYYATGLQALEKSEYNQAIEAFNVASKSQLLKSKALLQIARIRLFKLSDFEEKALELYELAYVEAVNFPATRHTILSELSKYLENHSDNLSVIKKLLEWHLLEADTRFKIGHYEFALHYFEMANSLSERMTDQSSDDHHRLLFSIAMTLSKCAETESGALKILKRLAKKDFIPAKIRVAAIVLNGQMQQGQDIAAAIKEFAEIAPNASAHDANCIIKELEPFHDNPLFTEEINAIYFQFLVSYKTLSKEIEIIIKKLATTGSAIQITFAKQLLNKIHRDKLNSILEPHNFVLLANNYLGSNIETSAILRVLSVVISNDAARLKKLKDDCQIALQNLSGDNVIRFYHGCLTEEKAKYYLPTLKLEFKTNDPIILILLAMRKAIENDGPLKLGNKEGIDPGLTETIPEIKRRVEQMLVDISSVTPEAAKELYADKEGEMKLLLVAANKAAANAKPQNQKLKVFDTLTPSATEQGTELKPLHPVINNKSI